MSEASAGSVALVQSPKAAPERIGIILVHGIGEQRRFEHLDGQVRYLIEALERLCGEDAVTVQIARGEAAAFHAEQDTWGAGSTPSVEIVVRSGIAGAPHESRILVHEVWWADVNERYSLAKQFRFWLWALAIWTYPSKKGSTSPIAARMAIPSIPGTHHSEAYDRFRLFLLAMFVSVLGFSVGWMAFLANRVFNWQTPDVLRVLANYLSAVKLYNQRQRFGPGLWWAREDFLDGTGEPPRESVRRRMVRTLCDVACNDYDRWYVLAHSQGSVVAFNGLMAPAYGWPGYLDEGRWGDLVSKGWAGPSFGPPPSPGGKVEPRRPVWAQPNDIAYRSRIFRRFRGFLTYGSPLEKFVGIWPARVGISREPVFQQDVSWINLYDPIDPVSGRLEAFAKYPPECCPTPLNVGYCASWWLLLAHLKYLTVRKKGKPDAASATAHWLLTDQTKGFFSGSKGLWPGSWFTGDARLQRIRSRIAWATWSLAFALLLAVSAIMLPMIVDLLHSVGKNLWAELQHVVAGT